MKAFQSARSFSFPDWFERCNNLFKYRTGKDIPAQMKMELSWKKWHNQGFTPLAAVNNVMDGMREDFRESQRYPG